MIFVVKKKKKKKKRVCLCEKHRSTGRWNAFLLLFFVCAVCLYYWQQRRQLKKKSVYRMRHQQEANQKKNTKTTRYSKQKQKATSDRLWNKRLVLRMWRRNESRELRAPLFVKREKQTYLLLGIHNNKAQIQCTVQKQTFCRKRELLLFSKQARAKRNTC